MNRDQRPKWRAEHGGVELEVSVQAKFTHVRKAAGSEEGLGGKTEMVHGNKEHMSISSSSFPMITNIWGRWTGRPGML